MHFPETDRDATATTLSHWGFDWIMPYWKQTKINWIEPDVSVKPFAGESLWTPQLSYHLEYLNGFIFVSLFPERQVEELLEYLHVSARCSSFLSFADPR